MSVERRGTKALELWARKATDGYQGVSVSNMTTAWRNGLAFCALIHSFRPDLIEFSSLKPENILENNALAFRVAEQQLGIPALLDAEDMVENDVPDRLSVLTYVSQYYQAFAAMGLTNKKRTGNTSAPQSTAPGTVMAKTSPPLQRKAKPEVKTDKVVAGGRVRREVCAGCNNPVFLAERLLVGSPGQLMHRTCFRCARCNTQLTLASYYETEKGQFCCETCPDEERNNILEVVDNASISSHTSSKHKRRSSASDSDSESDSNSEDSGEESDSYSHDVETLLEDKTHHVDTRSDTLSHSPKFTPKPLKPRTVFLSQTLEGNDINHDLNTKTEESKQSEGISHFSRVSSALFGSKERDSRATATGDSLRDHCDEAKASITDPPEKLILDTGQKDRTNNVTNGAIKTSSSIVAQRLKLFREISDKSVSSDKMNTSVEKREIKYNYLHLNKIEKETSCVTKEENKSIVEDPDKDKNTKDINSKFVHVDDMDSDLIVNEEENKKLMDSLENSETVDERESSPISENVRESIEPSPNSEKVSENLEQLPNSEKITESIEQLPNSVNDSESIEHKKVSESIEHEKLGERIEHEKVSESIEHEKVSKSVETSPTIPSICITRNKQEVSIARVADSSREREDSDVQHDSETKSLEEPPLSKDVLKEYNPFDDDESQQDESGVAIGHSDGGSNDDNLIATCVSQDSGADISSASLHSVQYPEDLNPFGSDDESHVQDATTDKAGVAEQSELQGNDDQKTTKKLIKVNMNPFESDEDDEFEKEMDKENKKKELKNLNPFWSDDEAGEERDNTKLTPSKNKVKPPRPPPPTLARNSTPSQMYESGGGSLQQSPIFQGGSATRKKISAPQPPTSMRDLFPPASPSTSPAQSHLSPSPSMTVPYPSPSPSSPSGSLALKRKARRAPAPPQAATPRSGRASPASSIADTLSSDTLSLSSIGAHTQEKPGHEEDQDEVLSWKMQKDLKNHSNKLNGTTDQQVPPPKPSRAFQASNNHACGTGLFRHGSMSKSEAGEWQRKKGPAPPRPVPQKRALKKLPMRIIQQQLQDIEIKQTELERQGVLLETTIRTRTENVLNNSVEDATTPSSGPNSIEVEDMILQLFELVNEKNELFRRQTELMYLKREKRLEEEYVELEYQIRCLMLKTPAEKSDADTTQEEELIGRLVKVVEQRDEIINCLELDRLREAQEDESIATHMMQYQEKHIDGIENGNSLQESPKKKKTLRLPKKKKKKKKEKKDKKGCKADADKDVDETEVTEVKKKKKKKWLF